MNDICPRSLSYLFLTIYFRKNKDKLAIEANQTFKEINRMTDIQKKSKYAIDCNRNSFM